MMRNRFLRLIILVIIFFASTLSSFAQDIDDSAQRQLVILTGMKEINLNPHTSNISTESQILDGLYEGLFSYNPVSLQSEPAICEDFKISRDKKTWTFKIRQNVCFSNGDSIKAQDVKDSWMRLLRIKDAPFSSLLDIISGVNEYRTGKGQEKDVAITVKDEYTLVVRLEFPAEYLPNILCHSAFSVISEKQNVFSGAFVLKERNPDYLLLEKNSKYWDAENVHLPSIKVLLSENEEENSYLYNNGEIDWSIGPIDVKKIIAREDVIISPQFGTEFYFFKINEEPWNNAKLRNALLYAIPWEKLLKSVLVPAISLIVPLAGYPEIYGVPEYDLDVAKKLLKESGFEGQELTLKIAVPDMEYSVNQASVLKEAWQELGINLVIQKTNQNKYLSSIPGWQAQLFTYSWIGDFADPMAFLELFRGDSSLNVSGWKDSTYDNLLAEAGKLSGNERLTKLAEAEQYLLDQGIIIPISHTLALNVINKKMIKGWHDNALNIHPLKYIYFEKPQKLPNVASL